VEIAADGADDDLPGVQPDADLDHGRVRASHATAVRSHTVPVALVGECSIPVA
jgi:hypothetical protein